MTDEGPGKYNRIFILALDGTPYSLLKKMMAGGRMPNLKKLAEETDFRQMDSVMPPVSSVAWTSFMTGTGPGDHGIYGFVDRNPETMQWYVPMNDHIKAETIQSRLTKSGKKLFMMNVPCTYPPKQVNGKLISGFLNNDISRATYPPELGTLLKARGYIIDADTEIAKQDLNRFYRHLVDVLERRIETMWHFWDQEDWDFFMTHIMETDRLHHFFWEFMEKDDPVWSGQFYKFYELIDRLIGKIVLEIPGDMPLMLLSDHGFTTLEKEAYLNNWLRDKGYLKFTRQYPETLQDLHPETLAYSLYPGRIYINLQGREKNGTVLPGVHYEQVRQEIKKSLLNFTDPQNGKKIIKRVIPGEEIFDRPAGDGNILNSNFIDPAKNHYPDLVAIAHTGYDLKGNLRHEQLFDKTVFNGMHTFDDAFILLRHGDLPRDRISIADIAKVIYEILHVDNSH
ncbi:MAG: alkaline phosphatase family protein [Calditrichaceae bacterium]